MPHPTMSDDALFSVYYTHYPTMAYLDYKYIYNLDIIIILSSSIQNLLNDTSNRNIETYTPTIQIKVHWITLGC